ncbi:MAG: polyprenyl synthetase family protein, partial [Chloroflexi bacterium]|nr:polyprenyl synthetase family protein [Chloroflexota bacterium]
SGDDGPTRHGRSTVWRVWGRPHAINAGDALHVVSALALLRLGAAGHPAEVVMQAALAVNETCLALCEGQYLDMDFESRSDVTEDDYRTMIGGKSAALIAASLELGALLGGASPAVTAALRGAGFDLGLAFQIQDDVLGVWGDEDRMGKAASDIAQRKKSLPVVIGFRDAGAEDHATLERVFSSERVGPAEVTAVLGVLERTGARARCEALAAEHHRRCLEQLAGSGLSDAALADLRAVIATLLGRDR